MGKAKGNALLINSPDYDKLFTELVSSLEACSYEHGDCEMCPLLKDCQKTWDRLVNTRTHYRLKPEDVTDFRDKFLNFKKQLTFC